MHAVASDGRPSYSLVTREAEEGCEMPAEEGGRAWVRPPDAVRLDRRLG